MALTALLATVLLATVLTGLGVAPASAAVGPAVSGRVVDASGRPVAGMLVAAVRADELWQNVSPLGDAAREVVTGADGRFEIHAPTSGAYAVRVCPAVDLGGGAQCMAPEEEPPYLRAYVGSGARATSWIALPRLLAPSTSARRLADVVVTAPSRIVGRLRNANVQVPGSGRPPELVVLRRLDGTQVGYRFLDDERYEFPGLAPGRYRVESYLRQLLPRRFRSEVVELGPQETRRVDATLGRPVEVTGRVTTGGRPVARQEVALLRDGVELTRTITDRDGLYVLRGDRPGRHVVRTVSAETPYLTASTAPFDLAAGGRATRDLAMVRGATVRFEVASAAASGVLHRLRDSSGRSVAGELVEGSTVRYQGLAPGRYTSTVVSGRSWTRRAFEVTGRASQDLGTIALDRRTVTWTGTTAPDTLLEIGDVRDVADERFAIASPRPQVSGPDGTFRVTGLVPGDYHVVARPPAASDRAPRVLGSLDLHADVRRDLPLAKGGVLTGRLVRASDGTAYEVPLAVEAGHLGDNRRYQYEFGVSDARGRFAVTSLMAGEVDVTTNVHEGTQHDYWEAGSPYYVVHDPVRVQVATGRVQDVGTLRLRVGGGLLASS